MKVAIQPCLLRVGARRFGDAPALLGPEERLTFRELDHRVSERARTLTTIGSPGAWVALKAAHSVEGLVGFLALLRAGFHVLPVNPAQPEEPLRMLATRNRIGRLLDPDGAELPAMEGSGSGVPRAETLEFVGDAPCTGILTSGSTGVPKLAVHSYRNHVLSAVGSASVMPLAPGDRYLLSLPWFHVGGVAILFRCLLGGAAVVLGGRVEDPDFLRDLRVSHVSMVEAQLQRLLARQDALPGLRGVLLGGGPVRPALLRSARDRGLPACMTYGLTEMSSQVIVQGPDGMVRLLPHRECRIAADGEILVRGDTLFLGYLEDGGLVPATDVDGWFHTRDLGYWDERVFQVLGRRDHQFISGGENVQPERIEDVLHRHPAIAQAVVVPRADAEFGQRPVAFLDATGEIQQDALRTWLRQYLNAWELPVAFHPLPRSEGMKILRADLVALAARGGP
ncbi:AMP-binding protein [Thioalkalivibrio sp.]|uniref:AMP-binding protein n=1 Tax=Thioalkalivibrio sp. TaxID=2093813 RepID=UPI0012D62C34|nr:AMP-binding protein [Thioalkalivibrio sp.]TVP78911.1 MAG: 2-succinylbenzoate-CoA ligase [Thioalkalivibrio sp.]